MSRTASERLVNIRLLAAAALVAVLRAAAAAQAPAVLSSEIEMSRQAASLRLELEDGRRVAVALRDGRAFFEGRDLGAAPRGGELDQAWRGLLNQAMDAQSAELPELLAEWPAPETQAARRLAAELRSLFASPAAAAAAPADTPAADAAALPADVINDSVARMRDRIRQLEQQVADMHERRPERTVESRARTPGVFGPLRHVARGISGLFSLLVTYGVLFGIAVVAIFFGARRYIEGVADTARHATARSFMVGIAGTFLAIPVFVLGIIALAISIVGIPALLVWVPLFPVAVVAACLLGYLAVAHAAGEGLAERRFTHETWFERGNSYYFILTGLGLLMAFFVAGYVVQMAGPWLGFIRGLLFFVGSVTTWAAITIGFGAALVSRGGSRPVRPPPADIEPDLFREEANV
jgi:hypothetical protein